MGSRQPNTATRTTTIGKRHEMVTPPACGGQTVPNAPPPSAGTQFQGSEPLCVLSRLATSRSSRQQGTTTSSKHKHPATWATDCRVGEPNRDFRCERDTGEREGHTGQICGHGTAGADIPRRIASDAVWWGLIRVVTGVLALAPRGSYSKHAPVPPRNQNSLIQDNHLK